MEKKESGIVKILIVSQVNSHGINTKRATAVININEHSGTKIIYRTYFELLSTSIGIFNNRT